MKIAKQKIFDLMNSYEEACNNILQAFCEKHDFDFEDARESWTIGRIGEVVFIADYYFDLSTLIDDLRMDAPEDKLLKWYDYSLECGHLGLTSPNYRNWLLGCPIHSREQLDKAHKLHQDVLDAKEILKKGLKEMKSNF